MDQVMELRQSFAKQLDECERKIDALTVQREQLRGALFAMDQVLSSKKAEAVPAEAPATETQGG